jgi:hypothetical protein
MSITWFRGIYELAKAEMPAKLLRSYTGTRFVFEGIS